MPKVGKAAQKKKEGRIEEILFNSIPSPWKEIFFLNFSRPWEKIIKRPVTRAIATKTWLVVGRQRTILTDFIEAEFGSGVYPSGYAIKVEVQLLQSIYNLCLHTHPYQSYMPKVKCDYQNAAFWFVCVWWERVLAPLGECLYPELNLFPLPSSKKGLERILQREISELSRIKSQGIDAFKFEDFENLSSYEHLKLVAGAVASDYDFFREKYWMPYIKAKEKKIKSSKKGSHGVLRKNGEDIHLQIGRGHSKKIHPPEDFFDYLRQHDLLIEPDPGDYLTWLQENDLDYPELYIQSG